MIPEWSELTATINMSNEGIAKDVVDSLYWDSRVDVSKVGVHVNDGIVTLSDTLSSYSERAAASEDAWIIHGVRDAKNQLKADVQKDVPSDNEIRSR